MTPQIALLMAEYNRWMNERMYEAAATLDAETLAADQGAFFGSILGTLNHIAAADTIWLHRFAQHEASFSSLSALAKYPQPSSLSQPLARDLKELRGYRSELDAIIESWVAELTPEHLSASITYGNMAGAKSSRNFGALLQHFFNHQTHHRGQASTLLFQSGVDIGVTDLLAVFPHITLHERIPPCSS
ncbi:DinB family protein [Azoarcus taiwanensis]|uniref:Damage-inducible protein DinB n=1 Tax=Azoarcus taiwanensis TaxID=666964 RepID=A0A972FI79_9RHOO|nr:DinB family protein [Azoarcus taiwanensis]NMG05220.1 damage-inducible protein DinB [Azoarcus taiwanensis]